MKNKKRLIQVIQFVFVGFLLSFTTSCDNDEDASPAELSTTEVTEIGQVSARAGGTITSDGGSKILAKGIVYGTNPGPTLEGNSTNSGPEAGTYSGMMTNLTFGTTYYVRAFAISEGAGAVYGNEVSFTTLLPDGVDCLADIWGGDLNCRDEVWSDYGPSYCTGEKMDNCNLLKVSFDIWGYGSSTEVVLELQIGEFDSSTYEGTVTLTKDAMVTAEGENITFHKGAAGTYKALSNELLLVLECTGTATSDGFYRFTVTPKE